MGNYRFRLSDMISNAWFYKLNNINNFTTNHHKKPPQNHHKPPQSHHFSHSRNPFYHSPKLSHFHNPPKIQSLHDPSTKSLSPNRKTIYKPSPKHTTESTRTLQDFFNSPITNPSPTSCTCQLNSPISHIEIDVNRTKKIGLAPETELELELELAPIVTRPAIKNVKEGNARKQPSGVRVRQTKNTRKIKANREALSRKEYLSASLVVVKSSFDPERDFMQSMVEMISETNVRSCKDLEELLACYLSLNSDEYHDVIIKAFEQIWFRLPDL